MNSQSRKPRLQASCSNLYYCAKGDWIVYDAPGVVDQFESIDHRPQPKNSEMVLVVFVKTARHAEIAIGHEFRQYAQERQPMVRLHPLQPVASREVAHAARSQDAVDLVQHASGTRHVFVDMRTNHNVERLVREVEGLGVHPR